MQYKTDQIADVKKIEKLNSLFFTLMAQGTEAEGEICMLKSATVWLLSHNAEILLFQKAILLLMKIA